MKKTKRRILLRHYNLIYIWLVLSTTFMGIIMDGLGSDIPFRIVTNSALNVPEVILITMFLNKYIYDSSEKS